MSDAYNLFRNIYTTMSIVLLLCFPQRLSREHLNSPDILMLRKYALFNQGQLKIVNSQRRTARKVYKIIQCYKLNINQTIKNIYLINFSQKHDVVYD